MRMNRICTLFTFNVPDFTKEKVGFRAREPMKRFFVDHVYN